MSVDTYLKGKNLSPYQRGSTKDDLEVLIAPELLRLGTKMSIYTTGRFRKRLAAALENSRDSDATCSTAEKP